MIGEGLHIVGQFCTLPPAALIAVAGLAALVWAGSLYVLLSRRKGREESKEREPFYGARSRSLALAVLILLTAVVVWAIAILWNCAWPTAPVEAGPSITPTLLPTATLTLFPTATPPLSISATPTLHPSATPTSSPTASPTPTLSPTATPTLPPTATSTPLPTSTPTPEPEGILRRIVITGELSALEVDGQILWSVVSVQCWGADGQELGRVSLTEIDAEYWLPAGTARVQLWIGPELGGADWWSKWDTLPTDAAPPEITLVITRVKREAPAPTLPTPRSSPTPGG